MPEQLAVLDRNAQEIEEAQKKREELVLSIVAQNPELVEQIASAVWGPLMVEAIGEKPRFIASQDAHYFHKAAEKIDPEKYQKVKASKLAALKSLEDAGHELSM